MPFTVKKNVPPLLTVGDLNVATPFVPVVADAFPEASPDHDPVTTAPDTSAPLLSLTVTAAVALRFVRLVVFVI